MYGKYDVSTPYFGDQWVTEDSGKAKKKVFKSKDTKIIVMVLELTTSMALLVYWTFPYVY